MASGGYRIIDFGGIDLGPQPVIDGIYDKIESSVGKPILIKNFVADGVEVHAVFTWPTHESAGGSILRYRLPYALTPKGLYTLAVSSEDKVSIFPYNYT